MLDYAGINYAMFTGKTSPSKRNEALKTFKTHDDVRVLILSSVGGAGLNLHQAQFVIFVVSPLVHSVI